MLQCDCRLIISSPYTKVTVFPVGSEKKHLCPVGELSISKRRQTTFTSSSVSQKDRKCAEVCRSGHHFFLMSQRVLVKGSFITLAVYLLSVPLVNTIIVLALRSSNNYVPLCRYYYLPNKNKNKNKTFDLSCTLHLNNLKVIQRHKKINIENKRRVPLTAILKRLLNRSLACLLTHVRVFIWQGQCTVLILVRF